MTPTKHNVPPNVQSQLNLHYANGLDTTSQHHIITLSHIPLHHPATKKTIRKIAQARLWIPQNPLTVLISCRERRRAGR